MGGQAGYPGGPMVGGFGPNLGSKLNLTHYGQTKELRSQNVAVHPGSQAILAQDRTPVRVLQVSTGKQDQLTTQQGIPQLVTVQLGKEVLAAGNDNDNWFTRARIRWGVGGVSDTLQCDWADGGLITVLAHEVEVDVIPVPATLYPGGPGVTDQFSTDERHVIYSCAVGEGSTDAIPPQFTTSVIELAPAQQFQFGVPSFTRAVSALCFNPANPLSYDSYQDISMSMIADTGGGKVYANHVGQTIAGGAAVPLGQARRVQIANVSAIENVRVCLVYHLAT